MCNKDYHNNLSLLAKLHIVCMLQQLSKESYFCYYFHFKDDNIETELKFEACCAWQKQIASRALGNS